MSATNEGTVRRLWRAGVIAGLIGVAGALAGCSSDDAMNADYDAGYAEAPAANDGIVAQGADKGSEAAVPAADTRSLIITGTLYITVEDPIVAADRAAGVVRNAGGRIDARRETAPDEHSAGSASMTMRIPADRLDAVVDDLRKLGTVDQFTTDSYDVTVEVTDLEARISTLRASTERIEALLAQAKDISDIITLESELDGRQAQLQSLEAQQRGLDDQVAMSTIDLSLTTEPVVIVEEEGPETFWDALESGWDGLLGFLSGVLIVVGVLLPWIGLLALIGIPVFFGVRARRSRAARRSSPSDAALAGAPAVAKPAPAKGSGAK